MVGLNLRSLSHLNESMIQWKVVYVLSTTLVLEGLDLILSLVLMASVYSGKPDLVLVIPVTIFLIAAASFAFSLILGQKLK